MENFAIYLTQFVNNDLAPALRIAQCIARNGINQPVNVSLNRLLTDEQKALLLKRDEYVQEEKEVIDFKLSITYQEDTDSNSIHNHFTWYATTMVNEHRNSGISLSLFSLNEMEYCERANDLISYLFTEMDKLAKKMEDKTIEIETEVKDA